VPSRARRRGAPERAPREQRLDPRARQAIAQPQRIEAHHARIRRERAARWARTGSLIPTPQHLTSAKWRASSSLQLRAEILAHVIGIDAVRELAVGRRERARCRDRRSSAPIARRYGAGSARCSITWKLTTASKRARETAGRDVGAAERRAGAALPGSGGTRSTPSRATPRARAARCPSRCRSRGRARARLRALRRRTRSRAVAREIEREQGQIVVQALAREAASGSRFAIRASCSASRVSSRAKQSPSPSAG
jgi:hypothetical protein